MKLKKIYINNLILSSVFKQLFYFIYPLITNRIICLKKQEEQKITTINKVGILMQWGIGDSAIFQPLINQIININPNVRIDIYGKEHNKHIFKNYRNNINFINLIPPWTAQKNKYNLFNSKYRDYFKKIFSYRENNYDFFITPRFDFRDNLQLLIFKSKKKIVFSGAGLKNFFTHTINLSYQDYLKTNNYVLAQRIINVICRSFKISKRNSSNESVSNNQNLKKNKFIVIHGGASINSRALCKCCYRFLSQILVDKKVKIIKHPSYDYKSLKIFFDEQNISNSLVSGNISKITDIIKNAKLYIGVDSGFLHIAAIHGITNLGFYKNVKLIRNWKPQNHSKSFDLFVHNVGCKYVKEKNKYLQLNTKNKLTKIKNTLKQNIND